METTQDTPTPNQSKSKQVSDLRDQIKTKEAQLAVIQEQYEKDLKELRAKLDPAVDKINVKQSAGIKPLDATKQGQLVARRSARDSARTTALAARDKATKEARLVYSRAVKEADKVFEDEAADIRAEFNKKAQELYSKIKQDQAGLSEKHDAAMEELITKADQAKKPVDDEITRLRAELSALSEK